MSSSSVSMVPSDETKCNNVEPGSYRKLIPDRKKSEKCSSTYVPHNRLSRYTTALANLVPVRFQRTPGSEIPVDKIGLFSNVFLSWLNEYVSAGCKNTMVDKPLPTIAAQESCQINGPRIEALWHAHIVERGQAGASVPKVAWQFVHTRVVFASLIYFLGMIFAIFTPVLWLQRIMAAGAEGNMNTSAYDNDASHSNYSYNSSSPSMDQSANRTRSIWHMIMVDNAMLFLDISVIVATELTSYFLIAWSAAMNIRTATRLRSACIALAYRKLMRSSIRFETPVHSTLTYYIPDSTTLCDLVKYGPQIFSGPLILLLSTVFIWYGLGHWAAIAIAILIFLYLSLLSSAYFLNGFAIRVIECSLHRLALLEELMGNIFQAKVAQWDTRFITKIKAVRKNELAEMKHGALSEGWNLCLVHIIPLIIASAITAPYLLLQEEIVCAYYIPCLILIFLNVKHCLRSSWLAVSSIARGLASLNKLKNVLTLKDVERHTDKPIDKNLAITINDGFFSWDFDRSRRSSTHFYLTTERASYSEVPSAKLPLINDLTGINFYVPKGKLIGICGAPGSGKTSLLLAIMGQLNHVTGHVTMDGTCSYMPEHLWLFEGTIKENIVMGDAFNPNLYYRVIQACHIADHINSLPGADDTDLSVIDLSVAQRQKITLARAIYTSRDINILDSPLSDIDEPESLEIFEKTIIQLLEGKTVILVSNRVQFLEKCDTIYMMHEGKILEHGAHEELIRSEAYSGLLESLKNKNQVGSSESLFGLTNQRGNSWVSNPLASIADLMYKEEKESEGLLNRTSYGIRPQIDYRPTGSSSGKCLNEFIYVLSVMYTMPIVTAPLLFFYIAQQTLTNTTHIAIISVSLVGFVLVLGTILIIIDSMDAYNVSKGMHDRWIQRIYRGHISVCSAISSTILLNICTLDLREVDYSLPKLKINVLIGMSISVFSAVTLAVLSPWLLIPAVAFIVGCIFYKYYIKNLLLALNESRIESVPPIYNYAVDTIKHRAVIQAYRKEREFVKKFHKYCDINTTAEFMLEATKLWIELRIKLWSLSNLVLVILICSTVNGLTDTHEVLGLAFICMIQLVQSFVHLIEAFIDVTRTLSSITYADNYMKNLPQEIKFHDDLRKDWPLVPSIHFQNVLPTSYSTDYEPMNFSIYAGEKVVIHGSPGMKRDFAKALLQLDEVFSGNILIGNMNIADIHTNTLRQYVDYVPAFPVLFNGSIRYNLEPNDRKPNKDVMAALQQVFLWEKVSKLGEKMDTDANSVFFSVAEKKLLMLARIYLNARSFSRSIIIIEDIDSDAEAITGLFQDLLKEFTVIVLSNKSTWTPQRVIKLQNLKILETRK